MTPDDIIRMAREAKLDQLWGDDPLTDWSVELTIFAALAIAAEREACAKVCEAQIQEWVDDRPRYAVSECAVAIRARGEE